MVDWKIGPTFPDEIRAAGVTLEGWSWGIIDGEVNFRDDVPQETRDGVMAVLAVHDPAKQTVPPTPYPPGAPGAEPTLIMISRYTILNRLVMAHHAEAFFKVLDKASRLQRELWSASILIRRDDMGIRLLLTEAGADPDEILAVDTSSGQAPPRPAPLANPPVMGTAVPPGTAPPPLAQMARPRK
jgi:hypothetical protein